jgi:hypothetical protein
MSGKTQNHPWLLIRRDWLMKKTLATPLIALFLVGCGSDEIVEPVDLQLVVSIEVTPRSLSLAVGEEATLSAVAKNAAGDPLSVTFDWRTENSSVATVSNLGVVMGVRVCFANVTAHVDQVVSNPVGVAVGPVAEAWSAGASSSSCGG